MKTRISIFIIVILGASTTILYSQKSVYTFPFENEYRLYPMNWQINMEELSSTYQTLGNIFTTEISGFGDNKMEQTSYSFISDTKVVDAVRFLEFYIAEQLIAPGNETSGTLEMSIIYFHEHLRFCAGSAIGILTLGISTLCGVPFATNVTDVEIEASFSGPDEYHIVTHRGVGRGRKSMSIYTSSTRKAHQDALRSALEDLNTRVMQDPSLTKEVTFNPEPVR